MDHFEHVKALLARIYGREQAPGLARRVEAIVERYRPRLPAARETRLQGELSERDAVLITYGDQVSTPGQAPLETLAEFCAQHLQGVVSAVHILPFYPYSSDDGFSVIDYRQVDPALGEWEMLAGLGRNFALMFDAVINHASSQSEWFQAFLRDDAQYRDYFMRVEGEPDLSQVTRPRTLPLLTAVETARGSEQVWTTFSADQVDLNYANPAVLLEMVDLLLFYVSQGAELIRLDAIAYLWKEIGTRCIHLPQTHAVIQLLRAALDAAAPYVFLITETNVPHAENVTYFGDGANEAQMVYNFALPPLALHTFLTGDARALARWAAGLGTPTERTTFFNFLASHDGIGVNPVREILSSTEIERLIARVQAHGGRVSYKHNPDGSQSAYELNISYFDALSDPKGDEPIELQAARFLAAHAILAALPGVPGIYFHSLFGSRSWVEGVEVSGRNRTINRQKLAREQVEAELRDPLSLRSLVFEGMKRLLQARAGSRAFHPNGGCQVEMDAPPGVFALRRTAPGGAERVLCLHNVTGYTQEVRMETFSDPPRDLLAGRRDPLTEGLDLLTGRQVERRAGKFISLEPYQAVWITL